MKCESPLLNLHESLSFLLLLADCVSFSLQTLPLLSSPCGLGEGRPVFLSVFAH